MKPYSVMFCMQTSLADLSFPIILNICPPATVLVLRAKSILYIRESSEVSSRRYESEWRSLSTCARRFNLVIRPSRRGMLRKGIAAAEMVLR